MRWHKVSRVRRASRASTAGNSSNAAFAADQRVERGSPRAAAARARRRRACVQRLRCAAADLPTCDDLSASRRRVKRLAERKLTARVAVPAELEHRRFEAGERERRREPCCRAARMHHQVGVARGVLRALERDAELRRNGRLARVDVDELDRAAARRRPRATRTSSAHDAGADYGDAIADSRRGIPQRVDRRLQIGREHGARAAARRRAARARPRPERRNAV